MGEMGLAWGQGPYTTRLTARKARSLKSPQGPEPGRPRAHMVHIHGTYTFLSGNLNFQISLCINIEIQTENWQ